MKKPKGKIEWTITEDDETWRASQAAAQSEPVHKTLHQKEVALATFIALLLLFLIDGWLWPHHKPVRGTSTSLQSNTEQVEMSLTQTVEFPAQSNKVANLQRLGDRMMAQVTVKYPEDGKLRVYRETHFYERAANKWQRIAPDPALLGPQKTLKIANFTILYRAADADAVYQAAPKIEQLYAILRQDFGVPAANASSLYTIEVAANHVQPLTNDGYIQRKITISSPILLSAPLEMSAATLLYQETVYPLARLTLIASTDQHNTLWKNNFLSWPSFVDALALWELWEHSGPLADGRSEVVSWLYANAQDGQARRLLPRDYTHLCRDFAIWQILPVDIGVPLACLEMDNKPLPTGQYPMLATGWPYGAPYFSRVAYLPKNGVSESITTETILECIVATYGRKKLPQLITAMGQYTTPETLVPALFGVSQADFEAGWQRYLAQRY